MVGYLFNKTISFITTLLLVSIVCFFMIKLSPGDKADAMLNLQGIGLNTDSSSDYYRAYNSLSKKLGLDKPWFYFTFESSNMITKFPENWDYIQVDLAKELMNNKIMSDHVIDYVDKLAQIDALCSNINNSDCTREVSFLYFQSDYDRIIERIGSLEDISSTPEGAGLASSLIPMKSSALLLSEKVKFFLPRIRINGFDNQYHRWLMKIIRLDFGTSVVDGLPVLTKVWSALKWTLIITILAYIVTISIGLPVGIFSAIRDGSKTVKGIEVLMNGLYAIPVFWMATMLIVFFTTPEYGSWTNIFPSPSFRVTGDQGVWSYLLRNIQLMILPIICLTLSALPIIVRLSKRAVLSESVNPYVVALKAKGLSAKRIYRRHIVPNALIPIVTLVSNSLPVALAGSLIVEIIFNIPGMGRLMFGSIQRYDWDVCFAILLLISLFTSVVLLSADILYARINPKIRYT